MDRMRLRIVEKIVKIVFRLDELVRFVDLNVEIVVGRGWNVWRNLSDENDLVWGEGVESKVNWSFLVVGYEKVLYGIHA